MFKTFKTVLGAGSALLIVGVVAAALWIGGQIAYETYYVKPNERLELQYAQMRINCAVFRDAYAAPVFSNGSSLRPEDIAELRAKRNARTEPVNTSPAAPVEPSAPIDRTKALDDMVQQQHEKRRIEANSLMYDFCEQVT